MMVLQLMMMRTRLIMVIRMVILVVMIRMIVVVVMINHKDVSNFSLHQEGRQETVAYILL